MSQLFFQQTALWYILSMPSPSRALVVSPRTKTALVRVAAGPLAPFHLAPSVDTHADTLVDDLCQASVRASAALRALRNGRNRQTVREYRKTLADLQGATAKAQVVLWEVEKANRATQCRPIESRGSELVSLCA